MNNNIKQYVKKAKEEKTKNWIKKNLANWLKKPTNLEDSTQIEHIIDYLDSDKSPPRIQYMSYEEAAHNTDKWTKTLIKKGAHIGEEDGDLKVLKTWDDGMSFVQLVGKNSFNREGHLMKHCVASYYGKKDCFIYSLRDKRNEPHCTVEIVTQNGERQVQQIKGKTNAPVKTEYVKYIFDILGELDIQVRDSELNNLGYSNLKQKAWDFIYENFEESSVKYMMFQNQKFFDNTSDLKMKEKKK